MKFLNILKADYSYQRIKLHKNMENLTLISGLFTLLIILCIDNIINIVLESKTTKCTTS